MDSLPQEIIDQIIDNLPRFSLRSSSLVAKRWRKRSQKRALNVIRFDSEFRVILWHIRTQGDPERIPSYIQVAKFDRIAKWDDSALFGRVLQNFTSTTLWISVTVLPDEMLEQISCGEFGKTITTLHLSYPQCSLSTAISMIIAFPNLQNLLIGYFETASTEATPTCRVLPQRRTLNLLQVVGRVDGVAQALANLHFAPHHLVLEVQSQNIRNLLVVSAANIVKLELIGMCSLCVHRESANNDCTEHPEQSISHPTNLPPFPALTSLKLCVSRSCPSLHLVNTLSSIPSARALASVTLEFWWRRSPKSDPPNVWNNLDRWLVQMARNTTVEGGLVLNLVTWQENGVPKSFLPKFQEVGKIIPDNYP